MNGGLDSGFRRNDGVVRGRRWIPAYAGMTVWFEGEDGFPPVRE